MTGNARIVAAIGWIVLTAVSTFAMAATSAAAGKQKAGACSACHGADGNSSAAGIPKLAGQMPEYLGKQMRDLRAGRRNNCKGIAPDASLSEADIADIAAFYSEQRIHPVAAAAGGSRLPLGEQIYAKGRKPPRFVPGCIGCHGLQGKGKSDWSRIMSAPPAVLPSSIGGQHPVYVAAQLRAFREGRRSNDEAAVMRKLASNLSDEEIDAVAAYVGAIAR